MINEPPVPVNIAAELEAVATAAGNAIAVASPTSGLSELFSRDPLKLTDVDIESIIVALREARHLWAKDELTAKAAGKRNTGGAGKAPKPQLTVTQLKSLSLDDIL